MMLNRLDILLILGYFSLTIGVGLLAARRAGRSSSEFFLSGRSMPWWLLGMSMVATTFRPTRPTW